MQAKSPTNCNAHLTESIFQTGYGKGTAANRKGRTL
ncbi:DUF6783 domain-containing protein [Anaerobutyricum hallii]